MKHARPCQFVDEDGPCEQGKNGNRHYGYSADHDYQPEPREGFGSRGSTLRSFSNRPGRVERRRETREAMDAHARAVPECEGRKYGIEHVCQGRLDQHHIIPRGAGGGKDYKIFATLCRVAHDYVETHRAEAKERGLLKKRPRPDLPPRRLKSRFDS